jgi:hypothetical protein
MATLPEVPNEVFQLLRTHVDFITRSSDAYDEGFLAEAKRFATSLRTLFHGELPYRSLMAQAEGLHGKFVSTATPSGSDNSSKYGGLIRTAKFDGRPIYFAPLDLFWYVRWLPFTDWWNEPVFVDDRRKELSRRELVLAIADMDCGSNFDPNLSGGYTLMSEHPTLGWTQKPGDGLITIPERAAIRQIVHETLRTLLPPYRKMPKGEVDARLAAAMQKACERPATIPPSPGCHRNDPCPCGNNKRFKYCHGAM